ncbi:MAG TPA: SusC/RagA family TonB-linked outer membrane protein [Anseongella sp.]|nr:SusC/RagA family TonB-linked outer membrane protein [Anseongella sp.]
MLFIFLSVLADKAKALQSQPIDETQEGPAGFTGWTDKADTLHLLYGDRPASENIQSVSTVYTRELTTTPAALYTYALTGRMAGLATNQIGGWPLKEGLFPPDVNPHLLPLDERYVRMVGRPGEPSDNSEIMVSVRGQRPVTIIDGVQRDISSIAPENIESITVLKDALSTILLGQRSSRGVLLVTTKRPQPGGPHVSFTAQAGMQTPVGLPKTLPAHEFAWLYNEALLNDGQEPAYTGADFNAYKDGSSPYTHPDVDWYESIFKEEAAISRYNLGVTGGGAAARYSVSLDYLNRQGLFRETDFNNPYNTNVEIKRYVINTNIDVDVNQNFSVALGLFGRIQDGNQSGSGTAAILNGLLSTPRNAYPVYNPDGSLAGSNTMRANLYGLLGNTGYQLDYSRDLVANIQLTYKMDDWLEGLWGKIQANTSVMTATATNRSKTFPVFEMAVTPVDTVYNQFGVPTDQMNIFRVTSNAQYWYAQVQLGFDRKLGSSGISALVHADQRQVTLTDAITRLPEKYTNIAARVAYNFDGKYFAEAAANYSGYDQFMPGNQFGLFYAGGLGWNMAEEPFIKDNISWINLFKWRATWGRTGNANVQYYVGKQYFDANFFQGYPWNSGAVNGIQEYPVPNPDVTWEKGDKLNAGVDISLFDNRLQLTAEYFRNEYFDLMQQRGKNSALIGNIWPDENIGEQLYTGQELELTWQDRAGDFHWFVSANASTLKTKVLFQDEVRRDFEWNKRTGQPVGQVFGYIAEGLFQSRQEIENSAVPAEFQPQPGDIKYRDQNNDGIINQFDEVPIGNTRPMAFYGATLGLSFKGFDLSILFQGVHNRSIVLTGAAEWEFHTLLGTGQAFEHHLNRWTPETAETATYPRLSTEFNNNNRLMSSYWVHPGNYFRIKNVDIGYTLPSSWTEHLKLGSVRIFANGLNLFTEASFDRIDPEVYGSAYPLQKVFNAGVNIKL